MLEEKQRPETDILAEDAPLDTPVVDNEDLPAIIIPEPEVQPKKKRTFLKVLSIYAAILLVVSSVALYFLHASLAKYEAGTTNAALRNYMNWVETENYEAIFESAGFEESGLNTKAEYIAYFDALFSDCGELSVREKPTTDGSKRYVLYGGDKRLANLLLAVSPEDKGATWYVNTELVYQKPFTLLASDDVRITVNGTDINLLSLPSKEVQSTVFSVEEDAELDLPTVREYTLEGLLNPPTITAFSLSGEACTVTTNDQVIRVDLPATAERSENEALAIKAAHTYAKFIAKDASRTELLKYIHKESQLYQTIRNFSNVWFNKHESYEFRNTVVSDYSCYTANDFSCIVSFEPVYTKNGKQIEAVPVHYRMTFVLIDDEWTLFALSQTTVEADDTTGTTTATGTGTTTAAGTTTTAVTTTTTAAG